MRWRGSSCPCRDSFHLMRPPQMVRLPPLVLSADRTVPLQAQRRENARLLPILNTLGHSDQVGASGQSRAVVSHEIPQLHIGPAEEAA